MEKWLLFKLDNIIWFSLAEEDKEGWKGFGYELYILIKSRKSLSKTASVAAVS